MNIAALRREYHLTVCQEIVRIQHGKNNDGSDIEYPNFADGASPASIDIAWGIVNRTLVTGKRLRDISDLPFDLPI